MLAGEILVEIVGREQIGGGLKRIMLHFRRRIRVRDQPRHSRIVGGRTRSASRGQHPGRIHPHDGRAVLLDENLQFGIQRQAQFPDVVGLVEADLALASRHRYENEPAHVRDELVAGLNLAWSRVELLRRGVDLRVRDVIRLIFCEGGECLLGLLEVGGAVFEAGNVGRRLWEVVFGRLACRPGGRDECEPTKGQKRPREEACVEHRFLEGEGENTPWEV